jgi:hypothetical protein
MQLTFSFGQNGSLPTIREAGALLYLLVESGVRLNWTADRKLATRWLSFSDAAAFCVAHHAELPHALLIEHT